MNGAGYIITSWALILGSVALYALYLGRRGRALSARVPVTRRRWMRAAPGRPE
jgi:hypothetical protein